MATNNTEYFVSLTDSDVQTFLEVEKKQNTKRETKSYHALVMAFLMAANEIKQLEDLTQAKFDSQFVFVTIQCIFHLEPYHPSTQQLFFKDCRSYLVHSLIKLTFLVNVGLLCLYDEQNKTWLLLDMEFLF